MLLKRALFGLAVGLLVGPLTMTLVQLYWEAGTSLGAADIGPILAVGGLLGVPVGVIMAVASGLVEYRSGLGVEWALVGALAAVLVIAGLGHFEPRPFSILLCLFMLAGILAERGAALLFKDTSQERPITGEAPMAYGVTAIVITVVYLGLLGFVLLAVD